MFTEYYKILDFDNIGSMLSIFFFDMCQYLNFNKSLFTKLSFVLDDLQCCKLLITMVKCFEYLSIRSFADKLQQFVTIGNVIIL